MEESRVEPEAAAPVAADPGLPGSKLAAFFVNREERRPRALVRLVVHFASLAVFVVALAFASRVLPGWLVVLLDFLAVVFVTWAAARFMDRRSFIDLGLRVDVRRGIDLVMGAIAGALAIGAVAAIELALGVARYEAVTIDATRISEASAAAWFFVVVAIQEELVFRGYHVVNLAEGLTSVRFPAPRAALLAVVVSSGVFGLAHAMNSGATVLSTFNIAVGGGCLLATGFLLTGDLAFSIGLHLTWNLGQCILGMAVSGIPVNGALVTRHVTGADWVTGGGFGPEAGVIGLVGMAIGTGIAIAYARAAYGPLGSRLRLRAPSV